VPKTLDNTREADETMVDNDDEVAQDEAMDELASYFSGKTPKILVTSSKQCSPVSGYIYIYKERRRSY
jgi:ribosome production factor 1